MQLSFPNEITKYFSHHPPTAVKNLLITTQGVISARTVNLNKVKDKIGVILEKPDVDPDSHYKRLIRFFKTEDKKALVESVLCVCFCLLQRKKVKYMAMDGTSWELGDKKIHLLTLTLIYDGVSIPIWWEELDKKGISSLEERKKVIEQASKHFNLQGLILLADREYIGEDWFNYLSGKRIGFVIRLKKGIYKDYVNQAAAAAKDTSAKMRYSKMEHKAGRCKYGCAKTIQIQGVDYTFAVFKNPKKDADEPLVYFLSTLENKKQIFRAYPIRWTIETCFKHLKSNGFNLEDINFKDTDKILLMMAIVVFAYVVSIYEGLKWYSVKKKVFKVYKSGKVYLAVSVFRKGLSCLSQKIGNLRKFIFYLTHVFKGKKLTILQNVQ